MVSYDPDEGLELRPEVAERLERSVAEHASGKVKAIPIEEVAKKLGLKMQMSYKEAVIKRYNCGTVTEKSPEMW